MNKSLHHIVVMLLFFSISDCFSQVITKSVAGSVAGATCPGIGIQYEVSLPSGFGACKITWKATNGSVQSQSSNTVIIKWNDTPGAKGKVEATFIDCGNNNDNKTATPLEELILSVKGQGWGNYTNSVNIDYCTTTSVYVSIPRMYVQGTGGLDQPPQLEVGYSWTLPPGWKELSTGNTGSVITTTSDIWLQRVVGNCSLAGNLKVEGTINHKCGSAGLSAAATITLNGASPIVTVGPQVGYQGPSYCNVQPVTFYATLNYALGCIQEYTWSYPTSWTFVSQSANSITLRPSGTPNDSQSISAKVKFSCGTIIQSGNYTPTFNKPSITGSGPVCFSGTTFNVDFAPPGSTVTWTASPSNLFSPASGSFTTVAGLNSFTVKTANSYINGSSQLVINVSNTSCNVNVNSDPISFWAGPPTQPGPISGEINPSVGGIYQYVSAYPSTGATYYNWILPYCNSGCTSPWSWFNGNVNGIINTLTPNFIVGSSSGNLQVAGFNGCGAGAYSKMRVSPVSGGGGGIQMIVAYPNPVNDVVNINWKDKEKNKSYEIVIYDKESSIVYRATHTEDEVRIPVQNLPNGIYYLILSQGDLKDSRSLQVSH